VKDSDDISEKSTSADTTLRADTGQNRFIAGQLSFGQITPTTELTLQARFIVTRSILLHVLHRYAIPIQPVHQPVEELQVNIVLHVPHRAICEGVVDSRGMG
jgi:hypothetical protein